MSQYRPAGKVGREKYPEINRGISTEEMGAAFAIAREEGLHRFDRRDPLFRVSAVP